MALFRYFIDTAIVGNNRLLVSTVKLRVPQGVTVLPIYLSKKRIKHEPFKVNRDELSKLECRFLGDSEMHSATCSLGSRPSNISVVMVRSAGHCAESSC